MPLCLEFPLVVYNNDKSICKHHNIIGDCILTLHQPTLETFLRDFLKPQIPIKITGE